MKRLFLTIITVLTLGFGLSFAGESPVKKAEGNGSEYFGGKKALIAYFSWGGTTQRMANQIQAITEADIFRIEPVNPYPTEYTPCTEVALEEKNSNARPEIKGRVENWDDYDIVFIGCPV